MENYTTVRKLPKKGGFGEIFLVRHKGGAGGGGGGDTYILKRSRLTKLSPEETAQLHNEVHIHHRMNRGLESQHENIVRFKESFVDRQVYGCIVLGVLPLCPASESRVH
eukprot:COSAG01_NODE_1136_length_11548_cov_30.375404_7_plen_109_part_00